MSRGGADLNFRELRTRWHLTEKSTRQVASNVLLANLLQLVILGRFNALISLRTFQLRSHLDRRGHPDALGNAAEDKNWARDRTVPRKAFRRGKSAN